MGRLSRRSILGFIAASPLVTAAPVSSAEGRRIATAGADIQAGGVRIGPVLDADDLADLGRDLAETLDQIEFERACIQTRLLHRLTAKGA